MAAEYEIALPTIPSDPKNQPKSRDEPWSRRIQRLRRVLPENKLDGLLISHQPNITYLSGFPSSESCLLITPERNFFITDSRYFNQARLYRDFSAGGIELVASGKSLFKAIAGLAAKANIKRLGFESRNLEFAAYQQIKGLLDSRRFLPTFGLEASYEWNSPDFASGQEGSYLLGLGIEWNLFKGLQDKAQLKEAKIGQEMLRHELRRLEDKMIMEIEEAVVAVTTGRESLSVTRERVNQAVESLRIIRKRYGEGLTNVVELENAELTVSSSRLEWLRAIYDLRIALARLRLVTGELITSLPALSCAPREEGA